MWVIKGAIYVNKGVLQMPMPLAARREPVGNQNKAAKYVFKHKM